MLQLKKRLLFVSTIVSLAGITASAYAGVWGSFGTLRNVEVDSDSSVTNGTATYVLFTNKPSGVPSCQLASSPNQYRAAGSPDHVKQMTALASQALLSGKPFQVHFMSICDLNGYALFDHASIGW